MSGTCKYCGYSGTNEALQQHSSECEFMIPDPTEIMNSRIERMIDNYTDDVCQLCGKKVKYDLIPLTPSPDSPGVCYDCLSESDKKMFDEFEKTLESDSCKGKNIK